MKKTTVLASQSYDIIMGKGLTKNCGSYISTLLPPTDNNKKLAVITDDNVKELYLDTVTNSLEKQGYAVCSYAFSAGEKSKNLHTYGDILSFLAENQLTRTDGILALGGGVTGDMAGFAAATYLRGLPVIQMPTTLLAAVDSSVGGKTAVDLPQGKNLVGAFQQPTLVLYDTDTASTLSQDLILDGLAETVKAALIGDPQLFDLLKNGPDPKDVAFLEDMVYKAVAVKKTVVETDETEKGMRMLLNLGHTAGHAIEQCSDYSVSHGKAVAVGTIIAAKISHIRGLASEQTVRSITELLGALGFSTDCPFNPQQLACAAFSDKKRKGNLITLVLPVSPGDCRLTDIPITELESLMASALS